ncbi:ribonuclease P protein subunit P38-like protein [Tasmannia lanceolata]|uniref:ribonuclease P protein subunit P38-like protein n=1 Tax=Tasmannia lanceolata TaxID=3420 RepID=UPI004063CE11
MMGEGEVSDSAVSVSKEKDDSIYPMYFGVSCAFVALRVLSSMKKPDSDEVRWSAVTDRILQGSAQLLGLLVWKAQKGEAIEGRFELINKLKKAEMEVAELRKRRTEDAKANEKVVGIFASQEQCWIRERKVLQQQIQALLKELQILERNKEDVISNLNDELEEKEKLGQSKDKAFEEEQRKIEELEEKVKIAETTAEELRETMKKEAREHSSELWKHKTAFIELVSNQRQLEAEMGRALRQVEATRQELDAVFEQKEELVLMVQKLSVEIVKMQKDAEQKDKILSAMLRKSKLDTAEKQMLLKEVKISKSRRKQAELETERWRAYCESKHGMHFRSNSSNRTDLRSDTLSGMKGMHSAEAGCSQNQRIAMQPNNSSVNPKTLLLEYLESDQGKEPECVTPKRMNTGKVDCFSRYSPDRDRELVITTDVTHLEDWVRLETEKYTSILEERHYAEIDAFAEQMRLKDEKLEAFRWRLLSMELESKRLQSQIEGLDDNLSHFREDNMKLEALLLEREMELKSLKEKFNLHSQQCRKISSNYYANLPGLESDTLLSEVKIIKRKLREKEAEQKASLVSVSQEVMSPIQERDSQKAVAEPKVFQTALKYEREQREKANMAIDIERSRSTNSMHPYDQFEEHTNVGIYEQSGEESERGENPTEGQSHSSSTVQAPEEEIEEEKEVNVDPGYVQEEYVPKNCQEEAEVVNKLVSIENWLIRKDSPWKTDLHALGVSYKIKRLEHQLVMLEKLAVKKPTSKDDSVNVLENCDKRKIDDQGQQMKGFLLVVSLLNKQVKRYQSLEEKTDDLCKRMHENDRDGRDRDSTIGPTKEQSGTLEHFLEETLQLQRYMVATGQKLIEIQSRITCIFIGSAEGIDESAGFNVRQFADNIRALYRDIQRGLEVRIARIIGVLEGTLACEGILHLRR